MLKTLRRVGTDILAGKNVESYVVAVVAVILALLGLIDSAPPNLQTAAILAALALLVFRITAPDTGQVDLDRVLRDRQSYGPFRDFIRGGTDLWVYGPSAVNVMSNSPDIEREVLSRGGKMRVLLQDPNVTESIELLRSQLDQMSVLLETDIARSISILESLKKRGHNVEYRFLRFSPGFSLVVIDADGRNGRAVVEMFGFSNTQITDRMHIEINRAASNHWFEYWAAQFETMWDSAYAPEGA
jgi:hypothetical protein